MSETERRQGERIRFEEPLPASVGSAAVIVLDVGPRGCKIEHQASLSIGSAASFAFESGGTRVELRATVLRSVLQGFRDGRKVFHSGLEFQEHDGESISILRRLAAGEPPAEELPLAVEVASAAPSPVPFLSFDDEELLEIVEAAAAREDARAGGDAPYVQCMLDGAGNWTRTPVFDPVPADSGFTVPLPDDERELDVLCRRFESLDARARKEMREALDARIRRSR